MPLTKTGNFILTEDALARAESSESLAREIERQASLVSGSENYEYMAHARERVREQRRMAEEYRRIAAGEYGPKRAEVAV